MLFIPFIIAFAFAFIFLTQEQFVGNGTGVADDIEVAAGDGRLHNALLRGQNDVAGDIPIIYGVTIVAEIINEIAVGSEVGTKDVFPIVGDDLWHLEGDIVGNVITRVLTVQFQLVAHNNSVFIASAATDVEVEHRVAHGLVCLVVVPTLEGPRTGSSRSNHTGRHIKLSRTLRLEIVGDGVSTRLLHHLPGIGILGPSAFVALDKTSHRVGGSLLRLLDKPRALGEYLAIGIVFRNGDGNEVEVVTIICTGVFLTDRNVTIIVAKKHLPSVISTITPPCGYYGQHITLLVDIVCATEMGGLCEVVRDVENAII